MNQLDQPVIKNYSLPKFGDIRGNLVFVQEYLHLPFEFDKIRWVHDLLNNNSYEDGVLLLEDEFIIAVSGSFVIRAKSFNTEEKATLCSPDEGVLLPKGVTRYISDVGTESIALIINVKSSDL